MTDLKKGSDATDGLWRATLDEMLAFWRALPPEERIQKVREQLETWAETLRPGCLYKEGLPGDWEGLLKTPPPEEEDGE